MALPEPSLPLPLSRQPLLLRAASGEVAALTGLWPEAGPFDFPRLDEGLQRDWMKRGRLGASFHTTLAFDPDDPGGGHGEFLAVLPFRRHEGRKGGDGAGERQREQQGEGTTAWTGKLFHGRAGSAGRRTRREWR